MNQLETSLQEIESTQTLHEPYPPSTIATSLSPISSSLPKPFDGNSSVPSFLSPLLRSHNFNKSSEPVNTGRVNIQEFITKETTFAKASQYVLQIDLNIVRKPLSINPNSKIIIAGDVNKLDIKMLINHLSLAQLVKSPTRGQRILDVFLTNVPHFWKKTNVEKSLVRSDQNMHGLSLS